MSEPIGRHPINWGMVGVFVTLGAYGVLSVMAFTVVREQGNNNEKAITLQSAEDREQNDRIRAIENNRSLEMQIADLKNEVVRLSVLIEGREDVKRRR